MYDKPSRTSDLILERLPETTKQFLRVIRCRRGGHFSYKKNDGVVNQAVEQLVIQSQKDHPRQDHVQDYMEGFISSQEVQILSWSFKH